MTTLTEVRERPILFSGEMVRAILEGRKSQTRRVVKPQPISEDSLWPSDESHIEWWNMVEEPSLRASWCPYGKPGERLWVKEPFWTGSPKGSVIGAVGFDAEIAKKLGYRSVNSRFMPRWASRILLEITDVRVERLQDITEEDAKAEGIPPIPEEFARALGVEPNSNYVKRFSIVWDSINSKRPGCDWASNPFVWCISFRRIANES